MKKIISVLIVLMIIQWGYALSPLNYHFLPSPWEVLVAARDGLVDGQIFIHVADSLKRVLLGFLVASVIGVCLGLLLGYYKKASEYLKPVIDILSPIPPIAWIPIAILLFGLGDNSAYFIVFLGGFFPIFTNTYVGATSLPNIYKNISDSFEIKRNIFFRKILFFSAMPYIFTGLRIGMGMSWMSVIAAELIGAQSGLGYFIQLNRLLLRTDNVILGMILIGIIGMILNRIIVLCGDLSMPWREKRYD